MEGITEVEAAAGRLPSGQTVAPLTSGSAQRLAPPARPADPKADEVVATAQAKIDKGDFASAIDELTPLEKKDPNRADVHVLLERAYTGVRNTRETGLAKWFATVASERAAGDAVQVHGANGYSDEYPVGRFYRNCKGAVIYEGTREIHTVMQADYVLGYRVDRATRMDLPAFDAAVTD